MTTPDDLRVALGDLAVLAQSDLRGLWRVATTAELARQALEETLPLLTATYGSAAATVAADWYDEHRSGLDVPGRFRAAPVAASPRGADVLARYGVGPLFDATPDFDLAKTLVAGGLQRRIVDHARDTIIGTSLADPQADGWQRVGSGECSFCRVLIDRGAVYSEATADFGAHDNCNCAAVPAFGGRPRPVRAYVKSTRNVTDADRKRVRDWIATNQT